MKKVIAIVVVLLIALIILMFYRQNSSTAQLEKLYAENFKGVNDSAKIQAAIDKAKDNKIKTVMLDEKKYKITSPILVREGVKLQFGYGTQFIVEGDFRVLELEKDASIEGAYIAISDPNFKSEVIYLDGKYKYYNTWYKTHVKDVNIVNWTESNLGTGISLYSGGTEHEISFINFENVKVVGMETGVKLVADKPPSGYAWINANRFLNLSLEDCVNMISLEGDTTIPNETSGNQFLNLQIQPSSKTNSILRVSGQYNEFDGMSWDLYQINHPNAVIELTKNSTGTTIDIPSLPTSRVSDQGQENRVNQ